MLDFSVLHDNMNIGKNSNGSDPVKRSIGYLIFQVTMVVYVLYALRSYIDYSADEQAVLINEAAGSEIACTTDWIVSYPGRVVIGCEEK